MGLHVHSRTVGRVTEFETLAVNAALQLDGSTVRRKQFPSSIDEFKQLFPLSGDT